jgi:thiol:disulfide interchange protein DsbD
VGALLAILFALAGGLILNLMPCVLPVISIKVLSLVRNSREDGGSRLRHSLLFTAGVVLSFLALGGVLVGLRSAGRLLGWGFQFQDPVVVGLAALLFFLVGLNLFGVFEVGSLPARLGAAGNAAAGSRSAGLRSFASGFFAAVVATPCTAPFMGAAMGYALTSPPLMSLAIFGVLGLGLAAPYVALSLLPGLGARLPAPGRWMETLRQLMGFPMMAAVVWMLFVFAGLAGSSSVVALVGALLAAGLGAWILGRWGGPDHRRAGRAAAGIIAFLLVAGAAAYVVTRAGESDGAQSPVTSAAASAWEPWSPQKVADMRSAGRPVLIDFTARWCLSCTVNETVLDSPAVMSMLREKNVATLRADWTSPDARIAQAIASYGRAGVPLYVLYVPGRDEPVLLPEILTPAVVRAALESVG